MKLLYLDVSHVLHPSVSTYGLVHSRSPWVDGHSEYENVPVLEMLLEPYSDVGIFLSDWTPVVHGIDRVKEHLGRLAARVVGTLYDDVTTKVRRTVPLRAGGEREMGYSVDDFRRMSRAQAVSAHVIWSKPHAWVAITSDYSDWTPDEREGHVVITNMLDALGTVAAQEELATRFEANYGRESEPPKMPSETSRRNWTTERPESQTKESDDDHPV
jgi:hypothetical protein